ncbi:MAG TPA: anti-sigma factor [Pseudolabrys sp.]|nr:anti-sigma factor [Pseudolabrys sp.]
MSDAFDHSGLPDDELIAAEYALGVLNPAERAAAAERVARDRAFARLVADWEDRLAPWASEIAEVAPPPELWGRIAAQLPAPAPQRAGLWDNLAFWRGLTLVTGALAAASVGLLIYLGSHFGPLTPEPPLVANIDGGGRHHFVATIDTIRGNIAVSPAAYAADATRVPELWLIPADGKPRPVGLLQADKPVTLALPADLVDLAESNAVLAVSLEPPGGSPTGLPTGPVIATGKLTSL